MSSSEVEALTKHYSGENVSSYLVALQLIYPVIYIINGGCLRIVTSQLLQ